MCSIYKQRNLCSLPAILLLRFIWAGVELRILKHIMLRNNHNDMIFFNVPEQEQTNDIDVVWAQTLFLSIQRNRVGKKCICLFGVKNDMAR